MIDTSGRGLLDANGEIADFDTLEEVLQDVFSNKLMIAPGYTCSEIVVLDGNCQTKAKRENLLTLLFDVFKFPTACLLSKSVAVLFASGNQTGLVVSSGESLTEVVPVVNNSPMTDAIKKSQTAGEELGLV